MLIAFRGPDGRYAPFTGEMSKLFYIEYLGKKFTFRYRYHNQLANTCPEYSRYYYTTRRLTNENNYEI